MKDDKAAVEYVQSTLKAAIMLLESELGIQRALPITMQLLRAVQACHDMLVAERRPDTAE
jgi:hypothetical protein